MTGILQQPLTGVINSVEQLENLHNELMEILITRDIIPKMKYYDFTRPPIEDFSCDNFRIEHIRNTHELQQWGQKQHNCVLTYNSMIAAGDYYIYRIKTPDEEATLGIAKGVNGEYEISQLLSARNRKVSRETDKLVTLWLERSLDEMAGYLDKFPLPELVTDEINIRPQKSLSFILGLPFSRLTMITLEEVARGKDVFFYEMLKPEAGIIALKKMHGQWEAVLVKTADGRDMQESTYSIIEQWLWDNTPEGELRQLKFRFNAKAQGCRDAEKFYHVVHEEQERLVCFTAVSA